MDTQIFGFSLSLIGGLLSVYALMRQRILYWIEPRDFVKIGCDGSFVIVRPGEESDFLDGGDPTDYTVEKVRMTARQYDKLPEFDGF